MMIFPITQSRIGKCRCFCVVRRAVRPIRVMYSICTPAYWNVQESWQSAAPLPHCRLCKFKVMISPPTFQLILFPSPMAKSFWTPPYLMKGCVRQWMLSYRSRVLAVPRKRTRLKRWPKHCAWNWHSIRNFLILLNLARNLMKFHNANWRVGRGLLNCSSSRNIPPILLWIRH